MGELPQRTTANTAAEHVTDHNVIHANFGWGINYRSGKYYTLPWSNAGTIVPLEGNLEVLPWPFPGDVSLSAIVEEVTSVGTVGAVRRVGIYADNDGMPGALLVDLGTYDATSTGLKEVAITGNLDVGGKVVWIGGVTQGAAGTRPTLRAASNVVSWPGLGFATAQIATINGGLRHSSVSGALPDPFTTSPALSGGNPRFAVKIA